MILIVSIFVNGKSFAYLTISESKKSFLFETKVCEHKEFREAKIANKTQINKFINFWCII